MQGQVDALRDLTYERRQQELEEFPFPYGEISILTLSSATERCTLLRPLQARLKRRYGLPNDGMVTAADADLPASLRVRLDFDWDHLDCAYPGTATEDDRLVNEAAVALLLRSVPREAPSCDICLEQVFAFWHEGRGEHTFHFGNPWHGERKGQPVFAAFTRARCPEAEPIYAFWCEQYQRHTLHCGEARVGEHRGAVVFYVFCECMDGCQTVYEFWHEENREHTIHLGDPWEGEARGDIQFYALAGPFLQNGSVNEFQFFA